MPMPYGSRGGMAFSADELRVLRRALAHALQTTSLSASLGALGAELTEDIQEYLRLAAAVDEAVREGGRLRAFLLADLARYRETLPGSAAGYLDRLREALAAGYVPGPDDLAALRTLNAHRTGPAERDRRTALLRHCERLAEHSVRARLRALPGGRTAAGPEPEPERKPEPEPRPAPQQPRPPSPRPDRPVPTPGEVFPPRRKPVRPPAGRTA
ncbi:hypothetical protein ACWIG3_04405 [Streptomyces celluloflavus]|uniref:hypothetical protein n=1 Tax=Streptomyces celluloflavus TaxID=58344 RepID=UPI00345F4786|nr:hypothetical protein OG717_16950 [Streptomyces celluloflavus]